MASELAKHQIAQEIAFGLPKVQIARAHGMTPGGLANLLRTQEMSDLVLKARDELLQKRDRALLKLAMNLDATAENIVAMANDLNHKDSFKANQQILETFRPPEQKGDQSITINLEAEVINALGDPLQKLLARHHDFDPTDRLLTGDEARPKAYGAGPTEEIPAEASQDARDSTISPSPDPTPGSD